jgi:tetratricopeptide (TPR) repeat protein
MQVKYLLVLVSLILIVSGCTNMQIAGDVQRGRQALLRGDPKAALPHFQTAAQLDPNYILDYSPLQQSVWTYVGKTYYEIGNLAEARKALQRARSHYNRDEIARLYLGLTLARDGDQQRGLKEIEAGLKGLNDWLDYMEQHHPDGRFWDPGRELRSQIERDLAIISGKDIRWPEIISSGEMLGNKLEDEIELVRKSQVLEQTRGEDGGGD